jgi:putative peptide zinc metalloprotease protein
MKKRLTFAVAALFAALAAGAAAPAPALAQDNQAIAVNLRDGAEVLRFAFDVTRVTRGVVDQQNAAVAYASCEECRTIAVAFQIVLVASDPEVVTPENVALAINYECTSCETLASAYQFVFSVPERFRFSKDAKERINEIRHELRRLLRSDAPIAELQAQIDALADELRAVIREDIARGGARPGRDDDNDDDDEREDDGDEGDGDSEAEEGDDEDEEDEETPPTTTTTPTGSTTTESGTTTTP